MASRKVRGLRGRLGGPWSKSSTRLRRRLWRRRDAPLEVEIGSLFQFLETITRQKRSLLNSLTESDSILLTPEQSLNRGGNNLDLLFTTNPTKEELQFWLKQFDRSSLVNGREKGLNAYLAVMDADYRTQVKAFAGDWSGNETCDDFHVGISRVCGLRISADSRAGKCANGCCDQCRG